jgi:hypothetical protein
MSDICLINDSLQNENNIPLLEPLTINEPIPSFTCEQIKSKFQTLQGKIIKNTEDDDFKFCMNLLGHHPIWKNKKDQVEGFTIEINKLNRKPDKNGLKPLCMKLKTTWSKKWLLVSWRKCIVKKTRKSKLSPTPKLSNENKSEIKENNTQDKHKKELLGAMRYAIRRQISNFKKTHGLSKICSICGKGKPIVNSQASLHVDHVIPFSTLTNDFLLHCEKLQIGIPQQFHYNRLTGQPRFQRGDKSFACRWQRYHQLNAELQWLCKHCNLSKGNKQK